MANIERFEDLKIWQESRKLANKIYEILLSNQEIRDFALKDQINRSSGSIMDNIAEGFDRKGNKEFRQFLTVSRGSCSEVKSQLYMAQDRKLISSDQFEELYESCENISKMAHGLMKYLNSSEYKGSKFKEPKLEYYVNKTKRTEN
ncbi:S23 ribosomal protein [Fulvivirga imtechensis AK7]|uniref:S23 ribosomal protein n=1 Tax=Fulvivirga imtechensis AK7 TaxID=1237149 RepID=L8JJJ3_9BACT|nr:four helix bundle protein [Fulvivirga imtechensis]ELR68970.1 S23 ribosomal protein [Fulvivirga imtechensis AK7]